VPRVLAFSVRAIFSPSFLDTTPMSFTACRIRTDASVDELLCASPSEDQLVKLDVGFFGTQQAGEATWANLDAYVVQLTKLPALPGMLIDYSLELGTYLRRGLTALYFPHER
jgi:hypothetical protein